MKYAVISGSHREQSQSAKIANFIAKRVREQLAGTQTYVFELTNNPLPMWDESVWDDTDKWQKTWGPVAKEFQSADGFIWVVPEWNGMLPSGVVNLLHLCSAKEVGHKPALITTVSGSRNGAYPVAQMRMNTAKNNRMVYIPEQLIVREAKNMFNGDQPASEDDRYLRERLDYALNLLQHYSQALAQVREAGIIDHKAFPNGM
jgi:NAD(P)H-dependent FMN reductase